MSERPVDTRTRDARDFGIDTDREAACEALERDDDRADAPLERISPPRPIPAAANATNPMQMLAAALASGIDVPTLRELMALSKDWEANEARKAYADAFAKFKSRPIEIRRNKLVDYPTRARDDRPAGHTTYRHATLDHVCDQVIGHLAKYGLSHSWRPRTEGSKVIVATRITHRLGHFEEVELEGSPDTSGGKNSIQAVGSVIYYLERYGLLAILGLAPKDADGRPVIPDDDGAGGAPVQREARQRPAAVEEPPPVDLEQREPAPAKKLLVGTAPLRIIRNALTTKGVAESLCCAAFELGKLEELEMRRVNEVLDWIKAR